MSQPPSEPPPYGAPPYSPQPPYGAPSPYPHPTPAWQQPPPGWGAAPPVTRPRRPPFPHAEPREYHQMFRTWSYAWWRPVVGILLLGLGMLIVVPLVLLPVLVVGVLIEGGEQDFAEAFFNAGTFQELTPSGLLYLNLTLGGLILWTWGLVRVLHTMRPRWLSSVVPRLRWGFLFVCIGLSVVALVAQLVVGAFVPQDANPDVSLEINPWTGTTLALGIVMLLTTPLQAAGEEYAFRGYLLQAVGSLSRRRWVALLVTATLFAMAHGLQNPPLFFDRFMFGLIAGWLVIRTGGLEAAIAMHVLNNYLAFTLALTFGDINETLTVSEVSWWNIPVTLTQSLVYAGLVVWVAGRRGLQRETRPPENQPFW
ncbi:MAG TPA: CPBP family glutamic-type intramembrane protease [Marmoricola sp.]|nr:CPBP family glutamic-type intramembrane protease [Marmoricola sp.]